MTTTAIVLVAWVVLLSLLLVGVLVGRWLGIRRG